VFVKEIRARIDTYFKIVLRNVRDTVPKQVGYFLVKMSQEKLQFELYQRINSNQQIIDMLGEPKSITERRATLNSIVNVLDKSLKILQRDPDITSAAGDEDPELADALRKDANERRIEKGNNSNGGQNGNPNMRPMGQGPQGNPN